MAEFSESDRRQAQGYVERLLGHDEAFFEELPNGFSLADVERDAEQFSFELEIATSVRGTFPVAYLEDGVVPVSFFQFGGPQVLPGMHPEFLRRGHRPPYWYDLWRDWLYFAAESHSRSQVSLKIEFVPAEQARESFLSRAGDFLATRLAWLRKFTGERGDSQPPGGDSTSWKFLRIPPSRGHPPSNAPACNFLVYTNTPSLSVYWSGAYYVSSNYFGAPTSPAQGPLQAGTYVFGVNGGAYGNAVQWDMNSVCSLPGSPSVHLNY